jgi:hypothetical protein
MVACLGHDALPWQNLCGFLKCNFAAMEQGTLTRIKVRSGAGVMIARSDRVVSLSIHQGTPRNSGSTAPTMSPATTNRWGAKAEPSVSHPGGFAVNARKTRGYISKQIVARAADLIEIKE